MNHQMFSFRFRLPPTFETKIPDHVLKDGAGQPLAISQDKYAIHVRSVNRFPAKEEAQAALQRAVRGMSILGIFLGYGIADFRTSAGDERRPATPEGGGLSILLDGDLGLERAIQTLNQLSKISEKYKRAATMFDDSCFVADHAVALILRTTGLEVLSPPQSAAENVIKAVDQLLQHIKQSGIDSSVADWLSGALGQQKSESISQAVRRHVTSMVPEAPKDAIKRIYQTRSKIVHGQLVDRVRVANDAMNAGTLLRYTVLRELGFQMPDVCLRD